MFLTALLCLSFAPPAAQGGREVHLLQDRLLNSSQSAESRVLALEELSMCTQSLSLEAIRAAEGIARGEWKVDYARCLARCGPEALPFLHKLLNQSNTLVKAEAVYGIVMQDVEKGEMFAMKYLRDARKSVETQVAALRALGDRGSMLAKPEALRRLGTAQGALLLEALDFLKKNPMQEDVRYLVEVLENHDGRPAAEASALLQGITGYRVGDDPRTWRFFMVKHQAAGTPFRREGGADEKDVSTISYMGIPIMGNRVIFVLDASGSMGSPLAERTGETRGERAVQELVALLPKLPKDGQFNIIFFESSVSKFSSSMVSRSDKNVARAIQWLESRRFHGGTNLFEGLADAFDFENVEEIILLSDGEPSVGEVQDPDRIRAWVQRWNRWRKIRLSTIALSAPRLARSFVAKLAEENGGVCRDIR
ncbi:MAG: VWA domain-containing protein [Planctomycetota bacterium]|nr:VWA domain-containing protein [Planctomycetota bacterium]